MGQQINEPAPFNTKLGEIESVFKGTEVPESSLAALVRSVDGSIVVTDKDGVVVSWNPASEQIWGYTARETIGKPISILLPEYVPESLMTDTIERLRRGESITHLDVVPVRKYGQRFDLSIKIFPIKDGSGQLIGTSWVYRDVTEQRRTAVAESFLAATVNSSADSIVGSDLDGTIRSWNRSSERLWGYTAEEAVGKHITMLFPPEQRSSYTGVPERLSGAENSEPFSATRLKKDGTLIDVSVTLSMVRDASGKLIGVSRIYRDITEEKQSADRAAYMAAIINSSQDSIIGTDMNGVVMSWNQASQHMWGYTAEEAIGKDLLALIVPHETIPGEKKKASDIVERLRRGERVDRFEAVRLRRDRTPVEVSVHISPIRNAAGHLLGASVNYRDITERKRSARELLRAKEEAEAMSRKLLERQAQSNKMEIELQLAQKLESTGRLAAGIAHEINTPLQFIGDSLHFLQESFQALLRAIEERRSSIPGDPSAPEGQAREDKTTEDSELVYYLDRTPRAINRTIEGVEHVTSLVRAMKEFCYRSPGEKLPVDLNKALNNTLLVCRNEYKYVAGVVTDFGDIPMVNCLPQEMNQVFLNLIVNAAHAIEAVVQGTSNKGVIRVRTGFEAGMVVIEIQDTGCGIPEEVRGRMFDPFFTTKPVGKGTGQGLAIARSIISDKHGGTLTFESRVGLGTTFTVRIPTGLDDPPAAAGALS